MKKILFLFLIPFCVKAQFTITSISNSVWNINASGDLTLGDPNFAYNRLFADGHFIFASGAISGLNGGQVSASGYIATQFGFGGDGSGLTNVGAANITGTIADARLSANVPRLNTNQDWTGSINTNFTGVQGIVDTNFSTGSYTDIRAGWMIATNYQSGSFIFITNGSVWFTNAQTGAWGRLTNGTVLLGPTNAAANITIDGRTGGQTNSGSMQASEFVGSIAKGTGLTASQISGVLPGTQVNFAPGANITFITNGQNVAIAASGSGTTPTFNPGQFDSGGGNTNLKAGLTVTNLFSDTVTATGAGFTGNGAGLTNLSSYAEMYIATTGTQVYQQNLTWSNYTGAQVFGSGFAVDTVAGTITNLIAGQNCTVTIFGRSAIGAAGRLVCYTNGAASLLDIGQFTTTDRDFGTGVWTFFNCPANMRFDQRSSGSASTIIAARLIVQTLK